ncbi:hypothetical protein CSOJ01_14222 [Colletotrichum sojae]|uniref:EamA domain-containing protein n=1 Tax=Colletotrichum sojae TaxID=2175907 RepID=A0A8H6MJK7_9PEZI|nr:hypothetical protein CSOJ01_14222 [Colletotrichum sojae]
MNKEVLSLSFWERHRPVLLVLSSQISAAGLNGLAKLFETGGEPIHPFQVLFVRFLITGIGCAVYLWVNERPSFPTGPPELRRLFALRAAAGVFGAFGFYFSIMYLKLSEATALNFLGPLAAMLLSRYLDYGSFEIVDRICALVALMGVIFVVQPDALFGPHADSSISAEQIVAEGRFQGRMMGFGFGLLGVCGGAAALTAIRSIGSRAHPLFSILYFAWTVVTVTSVAFFLMSNVHLTKTVLSWLKLTPLGILGFTMEYLLTAGVAGDPSSGAMIMIYSQVLWALLLDWVVWNAKVNLLALIGIASVVTSLVVVSSAKEWMWFRKTRYQAIGPDEDQEDEEVHELQPGSSVV